MSEKRQKKEDAEERAELAREACSWKEAVVISVVMEWVWCHGVTDGVAGVDWLGRP